jgi:hypothetical protein
MIVDTDDAGSGASYGRLQDLRGTDVHRIYGAHSCCFLGDNKVSAVKGKDSEVFALLCSRIESEQIEDIPAAGYSPFVLGFQADLLQQLRQGKNGAGPGRPNMPHVQKTFPVKPEKVSQRIVPEKFLCSCPAYDGLKKTNLNVSCMP